jgi:hypothetical protein
LKLPRFKINCFNIVDESSKRRELLSRRAA